ncbi:MAG: putative nucleotidyltransferase substrate binding domain-containing protein [Pseudomonadota bacterium]
MEAPTRTQSTDAQSKDLRSSISPILATRAPYASLPPHERDKILAEAAWRDCAAGERIYDVGDRLEGLFMVAEGQVAVRDANGSALSLLGPGNIFGERGLLRDGCAVTSASADKPSRLLVLPAAEFARLRREFSAFERFFSRADPAETAAATDVAAMRVADLMTPGPITCAPDASIQEVARVMRDNRVSCVLVVDAGGALSGIVTTRDLANRVLADGMPSAAPVSRAMTTDPIALTPDALAGDVMFEMLDRRIGHLPIVGEGRRPLGVITKTDLTRRQALSAPALAHEIQDAAGVSEIAAATRRIPELIAQMAGYGHRHDVITRQVTDIADAATKRLLVLAEAEFGPPPAPYLWLACGSQGRREQTGVSDQDNCLFLSDAAAPEDDGYFEKMARFVSEGLDACGYVFCPGEMMATTARWRQPTAVWRRYFEAWIEKPDPMAQMLASVMFDLRPIHGETALFEAVIGGVLERAAANSIFVAHMVVNAVGHAPPLGLFGGVATIRSGEHKQTVDLKHNGVAPVVDLARLYALRGRLRPVNTRARLEAAIAAGVVSESGGRDLLDAYDLIANTRLRHQARQAKAGAPVDNFMAPAALSDLERSHLRDAFVVVRTMQSALSHSRAAVM